MKFLLPAVAAATCLVSLGIAQHDGHDHGTADSPNGAASSASGNAWFDTTRLDLGSYFEKEEATGTFKFSNPRSQAHKLSRLQPSCACSKAVIRVGDRQYLIDAGKVLYRLDTAEDGSEEKVRVDHIAVEPGEQGEIEVHMTMAGIKGPKEASLGMQTTDTELPAVNLSWRATGATFFVVEPNEINLNEMSWADRREFQYTITSPQKKDFDIVGHDPLPAGMEVEYSKSMNDDGVAVWTVKGAYGPGAKESDHGGLIRLKTNVDDKVVATRVIAFLKGPLEMTPGGFIGLGQIKSDEGKEVEITLTPAGDFDLQVEKLEVDRFKLKSDDQRKFVTFTHHKEGPLVKVKIAIAPGMAPSYLSGVLKIHLNHPAVKLKEVMFNGFVR